MTGLTHVAEQRFALCQVANIAAHGVEDDILDAVLEGVSQFASGEWAPLNRVGDVVGAKWASAGVHMPQGFAAAYSAYVEAGWGTIGAPGQWGGQGLPFALQTAVIETLGTANMGLALCPILTAGAIDALRHHGSTEQQERYLHRLVSGEWTGTMNLTEPQAGSDVGALRARAEQRDDGTWLVSGQKIFISFGDHDMAPNIVHLVLARTPGAPAGTKGISLFLVPKFRLDADGAVGEPNDVRVVSIEHKLGLHASPTCVLAFGDHQQCVGELVGAEGDGMRAMFTMMNSARLNVGLQGVQVSEAATRRAVSYALDRVQSARAGSSSRDAVAIAEHPDVRRMLLRMKAQTAAARALVYYAAGMVDRAAGGDQAAKARLDLLTPLAKAHATDIGCEVASLCVQVHGGMGCVEETGAAQFLRDARITPIYEGTNGIQAADLVMRKLPLAGGEVLGDLLAEMARDAEARALRDLVSTCTTVARHMLAAGPDDRLAGSYPFLTMLSVAVCGWLLEKQARATGDDRFGKVMRTVVDFYLGWILPEAAGLSAAATAPGGALYQVEAWELAA